MADICSSEIDFKDVKILIGSDVPEAFWITGERRGRRGEPYAIKSLLGWTVIGPTGKSTQNDIATVNLLKHDDENLTNMVEKFWRTDFGHAYSVPIKSISAEDQRTLNLLEHLPHHPVFNPNKPEKTRVVFGCAAKFKGKSLNDHLMQGPDQTSSLLGVLLRFRQDHVAVVADIEAMFLQVRVDERDTDALRFLWWQDGDLEKEPDVYKMLVHIFCATSSTCCASFSLRQTAKDNQDTYSAQTIRSVERNFYVDDLLKSVKSENEALKLIKELKELLQRAGFNLTKWMSNSHKVLESIEQKERAKSVINLDLDKFPTERALGVVWDVTKDEFRFVPARKDKPLTRRGLLSMLSSFYDPLGFIAPIILLGKIILQNLCNKKLGWDDPIIEDDCMIWINWYDSIMTLEAANVPRCLKPVDFDCITHIEIHGFADASEHAYGAVLYIKMLDHSKGSCISFLLGKSRLCPIKPVTIPRLELAAAVLLVKLNQVAADELDIPINRTVLWTDSTTVLKYISNESRRFKPYVANRISIIHEHTTIDQWRYVPSLQNPADLASRGLHSSDTDSFKFWINGPEFLKRSDEFWPHRPVEEPVLMNNDLELRKEANVHLVISETDKFMTYFSSWLKLLRATAWLLRFKKYCQQKFLKKVGECKRG